MSLWPAGWTCSTSGKHRADTGSGEQLGSDLLLAETKTQLLSHLLDTQPQLKTGGSQCPSWTFWKEGPPLGTPHYFGVWMQLQPGATSTTECHAVTPV